MKTRTFPARMVRMVDGDTCRMDIDLGFHQWILDREVRLINLNTPESRTKDAHEKALGIYVWEHLQNKFPVGTEVWLVSHYQETGKYGRVIGDFTVGKTSWSAEVVELGIYSIYGEDKDWSAMSITARK